MSAVNDGGPAFPVPLTFRPADGQPMTAGQFFNGDVMSLRAYFAGQALAAIISCGGNVVPPKHRAARAIREADALIAELNKPPTT